MIKLLKKVITKVEIGHDGLGYILRNQNNQAIQLSSGTEINFISTDGDKVQFETEGHKFNLSVSLLANEEWVECIYE